MLQAAPEPMHQGVVRSSLSHALAAAEKAMLDGLDVVRALLDCAVEAAVTGSEQKAHEVARQAGELGTAPR